MGIAAVTLIVLHAQAGNLYAVPDRGDPLCSMWRIAWVQHQLLTSPRHLFDANIFYPLTATLTYSDAMLLPAIAATPLALARVHPVVAYNAVLLGAFILSGVSAYWLVRDLGWDQVAAWIAAVTFTLCPFRFNHLSHLELQMTMWMPVALLSVHRLMRAASATLRSSPTSARRRPTTFGLASGTRRIAHGFRASSMPSGRCSRA